MSEHDVNSKIAAFDELITKARDILVKKTKDYSSPTNTKVEAFRSSEMFGVPAMRGVLIRMNDKLIRVNNLMDKDPDVKEESLIDSLIDIVGYTAILYQLALERKEQSKHRPEPKIDIIRTICKCDNPNKDTSKSSK